MFDPKVFLANFVGVLSLNLFYISSVEREKGEVLKLTICADFLKGVVKYVFQFYTLFSLSTRYSLTIPFVNYFKIRV